MRWFIFKNTFYMNYIGSKNSLVKFIYNTITSVVWYDFSIIDWFAWTHQVGRFFKQRWHSVQSIDQLHFSNVLWKLYIDNCEDIEFDFSKIQSSWYEWFISKNYSYPLSERRYFTTDNAMIFDDIRNRIEKIKWTPLYNRILCSLIESMDSVSNTAWTYWAYLKSFKKAALNKLVVKPSEIITTSKYCKHHQWDCKEVLKNISADVLYIDPPYNTRQYNTYYHLLETMSLWDEPDIRWKTGLRNDTNWKSLWCSKITAQNELEEVIKNADVKYIFMSYSNEWILSYEQIKEAMSKYWEYSYKELPYKKYRWDKEDARNHIWNSVIEYIHILKKPSL